jgi:hypothetical protein
MYISLLTKIDKNKVKDIIKESQTNPHTTNHLLYLCINLVIIETSSNMKNNNASEVQGMNRRNLPIKFLRRP